MWYLFCITPQSMKKLIYILFGLLIAIVMLSWGWLQKARADFGNWNGLSDSYECMNYMIVADKIDKLSYDALVLGFDIKYIPTWMDRARAKVERRKIIKEIQTHSYHSTITDKIFVNNLSWLIYWWLPYLPSWLHYSDYG